MAGRVVASLAISLPASRYYAGTEALIEQVRNTATAATRALTLLRYTEPAGAPGSS